MKLISTHTHADFDGIASMIAAQKIHTDAHLLLPSHVSPDVQQYLALNRDAFSYYEEKDVNSDDIHTIILVDVNDVGRCSKVLQNASPTEVIVYDHHPQKTMVTGVQEQTGATVTILAEVIFEEEIALTEWERTLFALGLYSDTGSFTYGSTTIRDISVLHKLFEDGISLSVIQTYHGAVLNADQQQLLTELMQMAQTKHLHGINIAVSCMSSSTYVQNLGLIVENWLSLSTADVTIAIVEMNRAVFLVSRSQSERFNVQTLMESFDGGGHPSAAAATVKKTDRSSIFETVLHSLANYIDDAVTAKTFMSTPVKTVSSQMNMADVKATAIRFGHSGFPVVDDGQLVGMISVRDAHRATNHGFGHAPVKGYMTEQVISCIANTPIEDVENLMMRHDIGRIPVIDDEKLIGIISRSDLLSALYDAKKSKNVNVSEWLNQMLGPARTQFLQQLGKVADEEQMNVYLVGGIVRDLFLDIRNIDLDFVVEGDAIDFAEKLAHKFQAPVHEHEAFKTAKVFINDEWIDFASARAEYYDAPSSLPKVRRTSLKEDLGRRDFTINALAIQINEEHYGALLDPFEGVDDIKKQQLRPLHNLSFMEDPTRILRAIRFERRFGFSLTMESRRFIKEAELSIQELTVDRIRNEWQKMIDEGMVTEAYARLEELHVLQSFFPGARYNDRTTETLACFKSTDRGIVSTIYPLYTINLPDLERFAVTKQEQRLVQELSTLSNLRLGENTTYGDLHRSVKQISNHALRLTACTHTGHKHSLLNQYVEKRKNLPALIQAEDILVRGFEKGPIIKDTLQSVEELWFNDQIETREQALDYIDSLRNL